MLQICSVSGFHRSCDVHRVKHPLFWPLSSLIFVDVDGWEDYWPMKWHPCGQRRADSHRRQRSGRQDKAITLTIKILVITTTTTADRLSQVLYRGTYRGGVSCVLSIHVEAAIARTGGDSGTSTVVWHEQRQWVSRPLWAATFCVWWWWCFWCQRTELPSIPVSRR